MSATRVSHQRSYTVCGIPDQQSSMPAQARKHTCCRSGQNRSLLKFQFLAGSAWGINNGLQKPITSVKQRKRYSTNVLVSRLSPSACTNLCLPYILINSCVCSVRIAANTPAGKEATVRVDLAKTCLSRVDRKQSRSADAQVQRLRPLCTRTSIVSTAVH